jgi:hypothetical protein
MTAITCALKAVLGDVGAACADPQAEALEVNVADVVEGRRVRKSGSSGTFGDPVIR